MGKKSDFSDNEVLAEINTMTVAQIVVELRKRGAKLSGRKSELLERLEAYIRNKNFESPVIIRRQVYGHNIQHCYSSNSK